MADLVKVKGLKGKQNKKKWAKNIDVSGLLEQRAKSHDEQIRVTFQQPLIVEDESQKKRLPIDPNRFKSKGELLPKPVYNNRITRKSIFDNDLSDPWADQKNKSEEKAKVKVFYKQSEVPAIIPPLSGHSYHPKQEDIEQIIERVIDYEGPKEKIRREKVDKPER